ncbi:MAG: hypothetical protein MUC89_05950 [Acetobacteraceae bacterium]|jgi:hypothetical protein|nr:hypothetical protein [Acetobacteraceae bacterium]
MAAPRLLAKTDLAALVPVMEAGRPVIEQHARLAGLLAARGLSPGLFAEPVITRGADGAPSSVSWYGEADGEPAPLSSLSPARRAEAERVLAASLAALLPALDDADAGPLARRALLLAEPDSVLAVDGRVVLVGWGLVPRGAGQDEASLAGLLQAGLGRYVPALAAAGPGFFSGSPVASAAPAAPPPAVAPRAAPPPPPPPIAPAVPSPQPPGGASRAWWWLLPAGLLVAILFLLLGVWLGLRMCTAEFAGRELRAGVVDPTEAAAAIARQREANTRLEREIAAARAALQGEICRPAGPLAPLAPQPQGGTPGQQGEAPPAPEGPARLRIGEGNEPAAEGGEKAPEEPSPPPPPAR